MSEGTPRGDDLVLGIDLGTTFCSMAIVDRYGKPVIVTNAEGQASTPSVVHFYDRDACVVGDEATKMMVVDPTNVARFVKRSMGEPGFSLEYFGRSYTPQELSAIILRKLKDDAEEVLGREVRDAVITVPAYFNSAQRGATAEAGAIAGLQVLSIINEPTAAAITTGLERLGGNRKMMVVDLGGGTFDVTAMEIKGITFRTIASDGNAELGGKDWDDRLLDHVALRFVERFGLDPRDEPQPYQELYERSLAAKLSLSTHPKAIIPVNYQGHRMVVEVTRAEFEHMTRDLVEQCVETSRIVLGRTGMSWSDLDELILVGGSTRMPMVRERLQALSGHRQTPDVHPEECVALGAALAGVLRHRPDHPALASHRKALARRAAAIQGNRPPSTRRGLDLPVLPPAMPPGLPALQIEDATTHPLGVVVLDRDHNERIVTLLPAGSPVPCEKRGRFAYAYDNMTAVRVEVTEGTGKTRDEVKVMAVVVLEDLPPRPRGTPIDVVYRYGVNQILEVFVVDVETNRTRRARITLRGSMDTQGIEQARQHVASAQVT